MSGAYIVDEYFDSFVQAQPASGRYTDANEVLQDGLRLLEERERKLGALDDAIERGLTAIKAGRVHDLDKVCDELDADLAALSNRQAV